MPSRHIHIPAQGLLVVVLAVLLTLGATAPGQSVVASATQLITGKKIRDGSVELRDLSRRARVQLRGQKGPPGGPGQAGPRGGSGQAGPQGATGRQGDPGPAGQAAQLPPIEPRQSPQMENGWLNVDASFYKDRSGLVHLEGRVVAPATGGLHDGTVFTLPAGYRPPIASVFVYSRGGFQGDLVVEQDGRVRPNSPLPTDRESMYFGAISFRPAD